MQNEPKHLSKWTFLSHQIPPGCDYPVTVADSDCGHLNGGTLGSQRLDGARCLFSRSLWRGCGQRHLDTPPWSKHSAAAQHLTAPRRKQTTRRETRERAVHVDLRSTGQYLNCMSCGVTEPATVSNIFTNMPNWEVMQTSTAKKSLITLRKYEHKSDIQYEFHLKLVLLPMKQALFHFKNFGNWKRFKWINLNVEATGLYLILKWSRGPKRQFRPWSTLNRPEFEAVSLHFQTDTGLMCLTLKIQD